MTTTPASADARVCPSCGAVNSERSLFCAECGASLSHGEEMNTADATSPFAPGANADSESTAAFVPVIHPSKATDPTRSTPPVTSTVGPYPSAHMGDNQPYAQSSVWPGDHELVSTVSTHQGGSLRGFALGSIAILLTCIVLGAWLWAGVLDLGTRNSIADFFSFLNVRR